MKHEALTSQIDEHDSGSIGKCGRIISTKQKDKEGCVGKLAVRAGCFKLQTSVAHREG
jgi:hypothetical protein